MSTVVGVVSVPMASEVTAAVAQQGGVQGGKASHAKVRKSRIDKNMSLNMLIVFGLSSRMLQAKFSISFVVMNHQNYISDHI